METRAMYLFQFVDDAVLDFCTKVAHSFQRLTGRTNFFIAKIGITMASISVVINIMNYFHQILYDEGSMFWLVFSIIVLLSMFVLGSFLDKADELSQLSGERVKFPETSVPFRSCAARLMWILFSCTSTLYTADMFFEHRFGIIDVVERIFLPYGALVYSYFIAVDPLPPLKSKIRQWMEKFSKVQREPTTVSVRS